MFRVILLFAVAAMLMFGFISVFKHIDGKQWKLTGKAIAKVAFSLAFAAGVVASCGVLQHLTN